MELTKDVVEQVVKEYFKLHNYSYDTEKNVIWVLNNFNRNLKIKDFREVEEKKYYEYLDYLLKTKKRKTNTLRCYCLSLKKIFKILEEEEKILFNPFYRVKLIKADKNIRDKVITEEEVNRMFSIPDLKNEYEFRNRVILETFYGAGVRAKELLNLELDDFLIEERLIFVKDGKGKRDRIIPIGEHTYKYLKRYLKEVRPKILKRKRSKYLFPNRRGDKLQYTYLVQIIRDISKKANKNKRISPHVMRHTYATHLLKRGAGIRQIQLLLDHKSLSSTQVYINLNREHLKDEYEKYHPMENELYFDVYSRESKVLNNELEIGRRLVKKKTIDIE